MPGDFDGDADDLDRSNVARILGQKIGDARRAANVTSEKLAEVAGVARPTISNWENGKAIPDAFALMRIAQHLDLKIDNVLVAPRQPRKNVMLDLRLADHVLLHVEVSSLDGNDERAEDYEIQRFVGWMQSYASARLSGAPTPRGVTPRATAGAAGSRSPENPLLADALDLLTSRVEELDAQIQELRATRAHLDDERPRARG